MNEMDLVAENLRLAKKQWHRMLGGTELRNLTHLTNLYGLSLSRGDIQFLNGVWYVTHAGLIRLARRKRCAGIHSVAVSSLCDPKSQNWTFRATVFTTRACKGFVGYGDANPSNVSPRVHGAELRVAETRAVNRALRKAYGIGICSVEEIGSFNTPNVPERPVRKLPAKSSNGSNSHGANGNGSRVRDRLCQLIRQHNLDAELVKAYAVDFCGTTTLREASREQVEAFVAHLADWAEKDRNALLCQLNSYQSRPERTVATQEGAA